ncbi:hypothetical protein B4Q13_17250, partial [Lacticaseibacillus rhamnosus]
RCQCADGRRDHRRHRARHDRAGQCAAGQRPAGGGPGGRHHHAAGRSRSAQRSRQEPAGAGAALADHRRGRADQAGGHPGGLVGTPDEIIAMPKLGLPPIEAIRAATTNAAELMGWSDKIGSIEPGKFADIIAVSGDPIADVGELERAQDRGRAGDHLNLALVVGLSTLAPVHQWRPPSFTCRSAYIMIHRARHTVQKKT